MNFTRPLVLSIACVLSTPAADWPQWRGPQRTGHAASNERAISELPAQPKVVWKIKAGEGLASPVVAGGRAFLFDNQGGKETLRAIAATNGQEIWRAAIDDVFKDSQGPAGPRCTPLVDGDHVYVQSGRGELQCLTVADGRKVWSANFTKDFGATFIGEKGAAQGAARHGNNGAPAVHGDHLLVQVGSTNGASLVCFEKRTGRVIWKSQNDVSGYAAPMVATVAGVKQVISFTADGLIGLKMEDGQLLWRVPVKTAFSRHATTPVIHNDIVVVSSHQVGLMGIRISKSGEGQQAQQAWLSKEAAMNFASPVLVEERLYGVGPNKNVVCVDVNTGKTLWSRDGGFTTSADKTHAAFLVVGSNILMLTDGGTLALFPATAVASPELSRVQVCGANWCNPAYANGRLYLRDGLRQNGDWTCLELRP
jgi:outer membrane protein assembly factor BamB